MWILILEAGVALFLLVFIVWWTMYQGKGKKKPQLRQDKQDQQDNQQP
ncbi:MAG: hypothetical protein ABW202_04895 [Duganella sp.]